MDMDEIGIRLAYISHSLEYYSRHSLQYYFITFICSSCQFPCLLARSDSRRVLGTLKP